MASVAERASKVLKEISGVRTLYGVDQADERFLNDIRARETLTPKQQRYLRDLEVRVFGDNGDDE